MPKEIVEAEMVAGFDPAGCGVVPIENGAPGERITIGPDGDLWWLPDEWTTVEQTGPTTLTFTYPDDTTVSFDICDLIAACPLIMELLANMHPPAHLTNNDAPFAWDDGTQVGNIPVTTVVENADGSVTITAGNGTPAVTIAPAGGPDTWTTVAENNGNATLTFTYGDGSTKVVDVCALIASCLPVIRHGGAPDGTTLVGDPVRSIYVDDSDANCPVMYMKDADGSLLLIQRKALTSHVTGVSYHPDTATPADDRVLFPQPTATPMPGDAGRLVVTVACDTEVHYVVSIYLHSIVNPINRPLQYDIGNTVVETGLLVDGAPMVPEIPVEFSDYSQGEQTTLALTVALTAGTHTLQPYYRSLFVNAMDPATPPQAVWVARSVADAHWTL